MKLIIEYIFIINLFKDRNIMLLGQFEWYL